MERCLLVALLAGACRYDLDAVDRPGGDGGPPDATPSAEPNVMFVSSSERAPAVLGGIEGADALCAELAASGSVPDATYRAWLSSGGVDALDRLAGASGWVRQDGLPFAGTIADLTAGAILYPPALDEDGTDRSGGAVGALVATGTAAGGTAVGGDCGGFRSSDGTVTFGRGDGGTVEWTAADTLDCSTDMRIYCFGVDRAYELEPLEPGGRLAFLTEAPFEVSGGQSAADDACAADATAAGLGDREFLALLATSTDSALSRFEVSNARPWYRVDGVRVTADFAELTAPLEVTASGEQHLSVPVFTGAASATETGDATCTDWTDGGGASARMGSSARSSSEAFGGLGVLPCDTAAHLYCLEP